MASCLKQISAYLNYASSNSNLTPSLRSDDYNQDLSSSKLCHYFTPSLYSIIHCSNLADKNWMYSTWSRGSCPIESIPINILNPRWWWLGNPNLNHYSSEPITPSSRWRFTDSYCSLHFVILFIINRSSNVKK